MRCHFIASLFILTGIPTMKLRKIALAVFAVAAACSAQAQVATDLIAPAVNTTGTGLASGDQTILSTLMTDGNYISVAGASAVQSGFEKLVASLLTNPTYYIDATSSTGGKNITGASYVAVAGNLIAATTNLPAGAAVVVLYRTAGGSFNGVYPVIRNTAITALDVKNCSTSVGKGTAASPYSCAVNDPAAGGTGIAPDVGISDVEPKLFAATANLEGETLPTAVTSTELGTVTAYPMYALGFGLPLSASLSSGINISHATYAAIMAGAINNWSKVPGAVAADAGPIVICRRIPGSGTQALTNLYAANIGCTTAAGTTANRTFGGKVFSTTVGRVVAGVAQTNPSYDATQVANNANGVIVIEGNGSGDVRSCMDAAANGGTYTTKDRSSSKALTVNFGTGGYKAIGVLSLDSVKYSVSATSPNKKSSYTIGDANGLWQFRAFNGSGTVTNDEAGGFTAANPASGTATGLTYTTGGVVPKLDAIQNGDWPLTTYESFNIPARLAGDKLDLANQMLAAAQDPAVLRSIDALSYTALALPDLITKNTTTEGDVNVMHAASATGMCGPVVLRY